MFATDLKQHYSGVIMSTMTSQISIFYSTVCPGADERKHQSSAPLVCEGISPVSGGFPHKGSVTRKMFPFDEVIMKPRAVK